jgi:ATP-dependent Clp protease adapter protein ClpS
VDHYIRMGLAAAWALFILTGLIWWWRRRGSKHYPYSERATLILDAIRDGCDIGMIYWSKTQRRYISRVVTPQSLDGYAMRAVDHTTGAERIFKVTRIRLLHIIPAGAPKRAPSRLVLIPPITYAVIGLGVVALGLFAFAILHGHGPSQLITQLPPALEPTSTLASSPPHASVTSNSLTITERSTDTASSSVPSIIDPTISLPRHANTPLDDFLNEPTPTAPVVTNLCYVVVQNHPSYKINQVAGVLQALFHYRADRAIELEQSVRTLGRAVVWSGPKDRAERFRQFLEGYDIAATIEQETKHSQTNNPAAVVSNPPAVSADGH